MRNFRVPDFVPAVGWPSTSRIASPALICSRHAGEFGRPVSTVTDSMVEDRKPVVSTVRRMPNQPEAPPLAWLWLPRRESQCRSRVRGACAERASLATTRECTYRVCLTRKMCGERIKSWRACGRIRPRGSSSAGLETAAPSGLTIFGADAVRQDDVRSRDGGSKSGRVEAAGAVGSERHHTQLALGR
jgi:hypothetical protein